MRSHRNTVVAAGFVLALGAAPALAEAQAATVLSCKLTIEDGVRANPPSTVFVRIGADEFSDFADGVWGRNFCGAHGGGQAPEVVCQIHQGDFRADWAWRSNVGRLERHIVLDLRTGQFTDRDHNGLERKGTCTPSAEPPGKPAKS